MRIEPKDAKAGDAITWKGGGIVYEVLGRVLAFIDKESKWDRWAWHTGYIANILPDGEVVTSQAIAKGVEAVTYPNLLSLGNCRVYRWLDNPDQARMDNYTRQHNGDPYDIFDYLWVLISEISTITFHHPFRVVDGQKMCWENLSEFMRFMGREIQPEEEPCMLSRIVKALSGV